MKKKFYPFDECSCFVCLRRQNKQKTILSLFTYSVCEIFFKKSWEVGFPYCFLTDFTKFFSLDFGFLTEKASWITQNFKIWCHDKKNYKIQNLKKFKRFNRFWPNSITKVLDQYIIFVCSLRTVAQVLQKLELPQTFSIKFKIP